MITSVSEPRFRMLWVMTDDCLRPRQGGSHGPSSLEVMVYGFCALVMLLGLLIQMLAPANGCWLAMLGSGLTDVASFVVFATPCFSFVPSFFLHVGGLWRAELSKVTPHQLIHE